VLARDAQGRGIEDAVGARGIGFNQPRDRPVDLFGYPAEDQNTFLLPPNFNGQRLFTCHAPLTDNDVPGPPTGPETMGADCDMTGGSSGGGWVAGDGLLESVTSYGYQFEPGRLYGPYFGDAAKDLYERAGGRELGCARRPVTNLGGPGPDAFTGTAAGDSFRLVGADDAATGLAGNDAACGGGGADSLAGDYGSDRLRGGGGDDVLRGGPGRDVCDGGSGVDRAFGCEVVRRVP
jgi:Ca2+-binding RTX toxin-like protein